MMFFRSRGSRRTLFGSLDHVSKAVILSIPRTKPGGFYTNEENQGGCVAQQGLIFQEWSVESGGLL